MALGLAAESTAVTAGNELTSELKAPAAGVGQTAIFVAWLRHEESKRPDALFRDPFAQVMLDALSDDPSLAAVSEVIRRTHESARGFPEYFAVRTRFFDDALVAAMRGGIRQVVTLAAGLDGRTVRLACPPDTRWFEVDMPDMTVFKDALITRSGLPRRCERRGVGVDLTDDWPVALRHAGFDPGQPTAWLIEGLLMYLTDEAGDALLAELTALSAPGSRLMLEQLQAMMLGDEGKPARDRVESQGTTWLSARDDIAPWLAGHGWDARVYSGADPRIGHGRTVAPLPAGWLATSTLASPATDNTTHCTNTKELSLMTITADPISRPHEVVVPDHDELVARAAALRSDLWADAATCDRERRLTDKVITCITEAGLTRLMTPQRFGGYQTDMRTFLDVTTELARGCCSAAWVTGVLNAGNFVASLFPAAAQDELWGEDPDARTALVLGAPRAQVEHVEGGIRVTGEWPYASGSLHAGWVCVLIPSGTRAPGHDVHLVLIPVEDVVIRDTWHFSGMCGTGSNTIVAGAAFVPHHRAIPFMPLLSGDADQLADATHLYRNSLMGLFSVGLLGALIGGAETALEYVLEQGPNRPVAATTYANQTESPSFQLDLADAATTIDAAKLLAHRITDTVDSYAQNSRFPDLVIRARNRMDSNRVAHQCRETVDLLMTVYGSSAFAETNPLQRIWRDINVGSRHAAFGMGIPQQLHGRALIGRDPREISFLV